LGELYLDQKDKLDRESIIFVDRALSILTLNNLIVLITLPLCTLENSEVDALSRSLKHGQLSEPVIAGGHRHNSITLI
jgi:hypothetical protein